MIQSSQRADEGAHVAAALVEVEHHVGHALAGAVIGVLPAAPRVDRPGSGRDRVRSSGSAEVPAV